MHNSIRIRPGVKFRAISRPVRRLNEGSRSQVMSTASSVENTVTSMDSDKNCAISWGRRAPTTFFIPTSFIRRAALAVERFMKLMQAITRIKRAIRENSRIYSVRPPVEAP